MSLDWEIRGGFGGVPLKISLLSTPSQPESLGRKKRYQAHVDKEAAKRVVFYLAGKKNASPAGCLSLWGSQLTSLALMLSEGLIQERNQPPWTAFCR